MLMKREEEMEKPNMRRINTALLIILMAVMLSGCSSKTVTKEVTEAVTESQESESSVSEEESEPESVAFGVTAAIVCVESRLDAYRLDREEAGWTEEKGYPEGYVHEHQKKNSL